jgi:hypothetical protein
MKLRQEKDGREVAEILDVAEVRVHSGGVFVTLANGRGLRIDSVEGSYYEIIDSMLGEEFC